MKLTHRSLIPWLAITILFLSSCKGTSNSNSPSNLTIELVSPQTSTVIWPKSVYILAAVASNQTPVAAPDNQPVHITFYANGQSIGAVDSPLGLQATLKWTPPATGQFTVQAEVQANGRVVSSKLVQMCILNIDTTQGFRLWGYGYNGPCALPPANTSQEPIVFSPSAKPESLSYNHNCPSAVGPTIINFEVKVKDPANRVAFVNVKYSGQTYNFKSPIIIDGASETSMFDSVMLNQTSAAPDGTRIFTGSTEDLGPLSSAVLAGSSAKIEWSARGLKSDGVGSKQLLVEDGPHIISIGPCSAEPQLAP